MTSCFRLPENRGLVNEHAKDRMNDVQRKFKSKESSSMALRVMVRAPGASQEEQGDAFPASKNNGLT